LEVGGWKLESEPIIYKFIGPAGAYVMALPARDLTGADVVGAEREHITVAMIEGCGLYVKAEFVEVRPFCGAATVEGGRCRRGVEEWGQRCYQHQEVMDGA